jgi:hypothetical protein
MVLVGESFPDAKAQVTAEVTYEPRMLLKTIRAFRRRSSLGGSTTRSVASRPRWSACLSSGLLTRLRI